MNSRQATDELYEKSHKDNRKEVETSVARMLRVFEECGRGVDLRPGIEDTPDRVAKMWLDELCAGYGADVSQILKTFENEGNYTGMVIVKEVPLVSTCEHHLVPFTGVAHVGYFPGDRVVGLSKIKRLVDAYGRRLQIQERLTAEILNALDEHLQPRGAIVVLEAEHLCMSIRGVQAPSTKTVTSAVTGYFEENKDGCREEFLQLLGR